MSTPAAPVANASLEEARQRQWAAMRKVSQRTPRVAAAATRAAPAPPRPPSTPLLTGYPGPLIFAWVQIWPFEGALTEFKARLRIRGYRTTNKGVAETPQFDRSWEFATFGLTCGEILDLVARTLDEDWLDFRCERHQVDVDILRVRLPSFSIRIDGVLQ